jgi:hypothetical protein
MKYVRTFESYKSLKVELSKVNENALIDAVKESVLQVGDTYKVRSMVDIPQSLINSYVKKVKDSTGKNLRQFFGDVDIAEELLKYITLTGLDLEKIPGNALMGGAQGQGQAQPQVQVDTQVEVDPQAQSQDQPQAQLQVQAQEFEEPQAQSQVQAQEGQGQAQEGQGQDQEGQGQDQEGQEEGQGQDEEEEEKEEGEENEEELPL